MIYYLLQTIVFQLLFLASYDLFLKKETFFQWNRVYLVITPLLAIFLPFIKIPILQSVIPQRFLVVLPEVVLGSTTNAIKSNSIGSFPSFSVIEIIVFAGMVFSLLLFLWKWSQILQLKQKGKIKKMGQISMVSIADSTVVFSFINTIYIGEAISETAKKQILIHELTHIKQKHFIDLLYFEVLRILFWFNPLIYIFQNRIAELHEYIADAEAFAVTENKDYYQQILSQVFQTQKITFINTFFNHSLIKKRIVMLQKSKSKNVHLVKFALLLPVVALMLTFSSYSQEKKPSATSVESIPTPPNPPNPPMPSAPPASVTQSMEIQEDMSVPFAVIDQVPIYPGCENLADNEARKNCFSEKISALVIENFNTKVVKKGMNLEAKQRIAIQFKIDQKGNVVDVMARAAHPSLIEEAKRVIHLVPKMQPGKQKGKEVGVMYSLPIVFEISDKN